jgi:hypothetical protein
MKCKVLGCKGEIDESSHVSVIFIQGGAGFAHICTTCGRMHHTDGHLMYSCTERPAFYRNGNIVLGAKERCLVR